MTIKILVYLSYLWALSEFILTIIKRSKVKSVKKKGDKGSMILIWVVIPISLVAGFNLAYYGEAGFINYIVYTIGLLMFFQGLFVRWVTIIQLKSSFTTNVAINRNHELKTDGLFKIVRHPSYLGMVLIVAGLSISMNSLLSFLVVTFPVILAIAYRIKVEEALLLEEFGDKYAEYSKRTKRIIPFIY